MYGHLQGFLSYLDMLAEGGRRHAELMAGRDYAPANRKIPLTQRQISRLFEARQVSRVSTEH